MNYNTTLIGKKESKYEKVDAKQIEVETDLTCVPAHCKSIMVKLCIDDNSVTIPFKFNRRAYMMKSIFDDGYYDCGIVVCARVDDERFKNDVELHNGVPTRNYFNLPIKVNIAFLPYDANDKDSELDAECSCDYFYDNVNVHVGLDYLTQNIRLENDPLTNKVQLFIEED